MDYNDLQKNLFPAFPSRLLSDSPSCRENDSIQSRKNEVCIHFYWSILVTCSNILVISMYFKKFV